MNTELQLGIGSKLLWAGRQLQEYLLHFCLKKLRQNAANFLSIDDCN